MRPVIEQYTADNLSLQRTYPLDISASHVDRFNKFYADELTRLQSIDFGHLSHEDQVDYVLFRHLLISQQHQLAIRRKQIDEMMPLLPFEKNVEALLDAKRLMKTPNAEQTAATLTEIVRADRHGPA